jgi:D-alanine-D-alanine ligase
MKNLTVVLLGGLSGERKISFLTGKACFNALKKKGYRVKKLDAKGYFVDKLKKLKPKLIFNALHGKFGEDGFIQSLLEALKIPYTHSGVVASSLAMDKELSRIIFNKNNLKTPKYFSINRNYAHNINKKIRKKKIKFPIVIKPSNEGSSLGVYICKNVSQFKSKYRKLTKDYDKILVEEFIPGREIQVAIMGDRALGAIELVPRREFYDYKAKYSSKAGTQHIMPAPLCIF